MPSHTLCQTANDALKGLCTPLTSSALAGSPIPALCLSSSSIPAIKFFLFSFRTYASAICLPKSWLLSCLDIISPSLKSPTDFLASQSPFSALHYSEMYSWQLFQLPCVLRESSISCFFVLFCFVSTFTTGYRAFIHAPVITPILCQVLS